jgi:hypothetical protein
VSLDIRNPAPEELARTRTKGKPLAGWISTTGGQVVSMATAAAGAEVVFNAIQGVTRHADPGRLSAGPRGQSVRHHHHRAGAHDLFLAGNDSAAKATSSTLHNLCVVR